MRRNFQPHESRGLSSVWQPPNAEPQPSSDAPTRPISNGLGNRGAGYGHNAQPQSSFMQIRVDEIPTDNAEAMPVLPDAFGPEVPHSQVPPPSLDIPDARVASRYHMQRASPSWGPAGLSGGSYDKVPIEVALAERHEPCNMPLTPEQVQQVEDLFFVLRAAGLNVPSSVFKPMQQRYIFEAVEALFQLVSPLPADYTSDAEGAISLLQLLGYGDEKIEVGAYALRSPYLKASWPLVVDMLSWLVDLTGVGDSAETTPKSYPDHADFTDLLGIEADMNPEKYIEFAEINAFSLVQAQTEAKKDGDFIPEEYLSEVKRTLASYISEMNTAVKAHQSTLDVLNKRISEISLELTGFAEDMSDCETLKQEVHDLELQLEQISTEKENRREEITRLQSHLDDLIGRERVDAAEMEKVHAEVVSCGLPSVTEAVGLVSALHDLKSQYELLAKSVNEAAERAVHKYERPARAELTSVRIALEEYNDGVDLDIAVNGHIPRDVESIWGRSMLSLLGGDSQNDLSKFKRKWEERQANEKNQLQKLEDEFDIMEAEIASLETRAATHRKEIEGHSQTIKTFESDRDSLDEMIASLQNEQLTRKERISRHKLQLEASTKLIRTLENRVAQLKEEETSSEPNIQRSIKRKQFYEIKLLEYQNAYSLLEQKVSEVERATSGLSQAKLDATMWLEDLKPTTPVLEERLEGNDDYQYSRARALELLHL